MSIILNLGPKWPKLQHFDWTDLLGWVAILGALGLGFLLNHFLPFWAALPLTLLVGAGVAIFILELVFMTNWRV